MLNALELQKNINDNLSAMIADSNPSVDTDMYMFTESEEELNSEISSLDQTDSLLNDIGLAIQRQGGL